MPVKNKKITRIMRVTLDKEEFDKLDKGETHSDNGIRDKRGKLSALPDIAPVSIDELRRDKVPEREDNYRQSRMASAVEKITDTSVQLASDIISDPEIQDDIHLLVKGWWHYKVKPRIIARINRFKNEYFRGNNTSDSNAKQSVEYQYEIKNEKGETYIVTGEQAKLLVEELRKKASEITQLIYILSNICIKDQKNQEEYVLEQSYIKQLLSEETTNTMKILIQNKQLIDEKTALSFSDILSGHIRRGDQLIPLPIEEKELSQTIKCKNKHD